MALFERWQAGDLQAGNRLFSRYFQAIHQFFDNKLERDVEELVQATFLACVKGRDRFRKMSSFRTFLYSIARRQLYRHLRDHYGKARNVDFGVTSLIDLGTNAHSLLQRGQDRDVLVRSLLQLPLEQQLLLELFYWENMTTAQLAEVFEVTPPTIGSRLFRARAALREHLHRQASAPKLDDHSEQGFDTWARALKQKTAVRKQSSAADRLRRSRS